MAVQRLRSWCNTSRPRPVEPGPAFLPLTRISSTNDTQQLQLFNRGSNKQSEMSRYTISDNTNCFNTANSINANSINVRNYFTIPDDRSQLLTWLSPLEPSLRHRDIRERRVNDIGEWLMQTEEFRRWRGLSGEGGGDGAVIFCHGDPGVGKTFIM